MKKIIGPMKIKIPQAIKYISLNVKTLKICP